VIEDRDYMRERYEGRPDEVTLAPITIKIGPNPLPDPATPEGRHEMDLNGKIFLFVIVCIIAGHFLYP